MRHLSHLCRRVSHPCRIGLHECRMSWETGAEHRGLVACRTGMRGGATKAVWEGEESTRGGWTTGGLRLSMNRRGLGSRLIIVLFGLRASLKLGCRTVLGKVRGRASEAPFAARPTAYVRPPFYAYLGPALTATVSNRPSGIWSETVTVSADAQAMCVMVPFLNARTSR
jgi:hypothetical protein